jgi:hypothetical protein
MAHLRPQRVRAKGGETITSSGYNTTRRGRISSHYDSGRTRATSFPHRPTRIIGPYRSGNYSDVEAPLKSHEVFSRSMTYARRFVPAMRRPDTVLNLCLIQAV